MNVLYNVFESNVHYLLYVYAIFWNKDIELNYFNIVCASAYEKARATIVTLHRLIDYVLPNVTAFQDGRTNFVLLKKIALRRIASAIGRWHHNCNSRDQFRYYTRDIGHTITRGK